MKGYGSAPGDGGGAAVRGRRARRDRGAGGARPDRGAEAAAADLRRLPRRLPPEPRPGGRRLSRARSLRAVPGVELAEIDDPGMCCGSAGTYNLRPAARRRASSASARRARSWPPSPTSSRRPTPGCAVQLGRGAQEARAGGDVSHRPSGRAGRPGRWLSAVGRPDPEARVARLEGVLDHAEQLSTERVEKSISSRRRPENARIAVSASIGAAREAAVDRPAGSGAAAAGRPAPPRASSPSPRPRRTAR